MISLLDKIMLNCRTVHNLKQDKQSRMIYGGEDLRGLCSHILESDRSIRFVGL